MQIVLGILNLVLGISFLLVPIIFIELGRPKDLLKSSLLILLGIILLIASRSFSRENSLILIINSLTITILVFEIFKNRWTQLSQKEKEELKTFSSIKSNLIIFFDALKLTFQKIYGNLLKQDAELNIPPPKKWIRAENKKSINNLQDLNSKPSSLNFESTNNQKKDIINDEKI